MLDRFYVFLRVLFDDVLGGFKASDSGVLGVGVEDFRIRNVGTVDS